ncbi:Hypothetical protein I595_752 [Croceitalea dokdonensis DOKDO 023]|uniref:Uncharacterized protein n=1 Tax=Croceitalea dokdonensis DOKDO 023 TaxID=1300341 RepID=A0A0P7AZU1_9FLAO|nr:Hypothetical protein I595_752 [Croceitalea dokdonensis DOKDO 023]
MYQLSTTIYFTFFPSRSFSQLGLRDIGFGGVLLGFQKRLNN